MRYAKIREMDISNGEGIGISLFVQGCHFHCKGCFNPETWDFNGGNEWTDEVENKFIELAGLPYIKRISILGGEPLANENAISVCSIIQRLKNTYPEKKIWLYTGYLWEEVYKEPYLASDKTQQTIQSARLNAVTLSDIVIDGKFQLENQDLYNEKVVWAGSTNQRVIDVKKQINEKE